MKLEYCEFLKSIKPIYDAFKSSQNISLSDTTWNKIAEIRKSYDGLITNRYCPACNLEAIRICFVHYDLYEKAQAQHLADLNTLAAMQLETSDKEYKETIKRKRHR